MGESELTDLGIAAAPEVNMGSPIKCAAKVCTLADLSGAIRHTAIQPAANQQKFFACNFLLCCTCSCMWVAGPVLQSCIGLFYRLVLHADPAVFHGLVP